MTIPQLLDPLHEQGKQTRYDYVGVNLDSNEKLVKVICTVQAMIPKEAIYLAPDDDYGLQEDLHITIFYGLLPSGASDHSRDYQYKLIKQFVRRTEFEEYTLTFGEISFFHSEKYDVMKVGVHSPALEKLHNFIRDEFKTEETHSDYQPHLTIAYVHKGSCDHFDGKSLSITGQTIEIPDPYYQFTDKEKLAIDFS
jgi:hypothetical protein